MIISREVRGLSRRTAIGHMFDWGLIFLRDLALAVWLGGLIVIDLIEAPIRFRVPEINRNQSVAIGRRVFAALNRLEAVAGAIMLTASALLMRSAATVGTGERLAFGLVGAMWLIALAQLVWLRPRMSRLAKGLDLVNRRPDDARYARVGRLHRLYVAFDFVKMAAGIAVVALWARAGT
ncbi:MAG: DUF4149 domain-containing protein [Pyrinomonas methylaliphatogenes]|nr:DUF4149 domain-containing protein [Pyrinomonas methylaliphatogenes]